MHVHHVFFEHFFAVVARLLLPWVPEVFSRERRGASFRRQKAKYTSGEAARIKLFAQVTF